MTFDEIEREQSAATTKAEQIAKDRALVARLEEVRARNADKKGEDRRDAGYREVFKAEGIDLDFLPIEDAGKALAGRAVAVELAAALDDWASARRPPPKGADGADPLAAARQAIPNDADAANRLLEVARIADPDPWRNRLREAIAKNDRSTLAELAGGKLAAHPAQSLVLLGTSLANVGELDRAETVLRDAQRRSPGDFWINYTLANVLSRFKPPRGDEVIRFLSNAVAIRPTSILAHNDLGVALSNADRSEECLAEFREATRLWPENALLRGNLASMLHVRQQLQGAAALKRDAIAADPNNPSLYVNLADTLFDDYQFDAAIENCRKAIRLKPDDGTAHTWLGRSLAAKGRLDEAIDELRLGVGLDPGHYNSHTYYGTALRQAGRLDESVAALRRAIELNSSAQNAMNYLGNSLDDLGLIDEAIEQYTKSLALKSARDEARHQMLSALLAIGEGTKAEEVGREAERAVPKRAIVGHLRSSLLLARGEPTAALKALESARKQKPEGYRPDTILEEEIRQAIRLEPLARKLDAVLGGREAPVDESERATLADLALRRGRSAASAKLFREAFARQPTLADDLQAGHRARAALAAVRAGLGIDADEPKAEETARAAWRRQGLDWLRAELEARGKVADDGKATLKDHNAWTRTLRIWKRHRDLAGVREAKALDGLPETERDGWRLFWAEVDRRLSRTDERPAMNYQAHVFALIKEAIGKYPGSETTRLGLAGELAGQGKLDEAMTQYREAAQSKPKDPNIYWTCGQKMFSLGRFEEATVALKEAVRLKPDNADYLNWLASALFNQRKYAEAAELERKATELEPNIGWR